MDLATAKDSGKAGSVGRSLADLVHALSVLVAEMQCKPTGRQNTPFDLPGCRLGVVPLYTHVMPVRCHTYMTIIWE